MTRGVIVIVRHGHTAWNGVRNIGWADPPLDAIGLMQASKAASLLAEWPLGAVYSSPLRRAAATAAAVAAPHGLRVEVSPDLRELHVGDAQGSLTADRRLRVKACHRTTALPGGESLTDVWARAGRFAARLEPDLRAGRSVAVVGHRRLNQLLVGRLVGQAFDDALDAPVLRSGNGAAFELAYVASEGGCLRVEPRGFVGERSVSRAVAAGPAAAVGQHHRRFDLPPRDRPVSAEQLAGKTDRRQQRNG